jgi:pimeloyl-ACP methyl ester carboxylesterase
LSILFYKRPLWLIDGVMHARLGLSRIRSKYVKVGPYRVHYFVGGHGTPLVLIHGLGSRSEDWTPQMPSYAKNGFRVYAIDLLGCGRTDHPDIEYTMQQQADLVHEFLDAVHVRQADVIGWSMGGWVALEFALQHPDKTRRLVLMNSAGLPFDTALTPDIFEPRTIPELKRLEEALTPRSRYLPEFLRRDMLRTMRRNSPVIRRALESMIQDRGSLDGSLGRLNMPVLILWGEQDVLIPSSVGFEMHRQIPQSVIQIYSGCGHLGPAFCAGRIAPNVQEFLASDPPMAGGIYHY